MKKSVKQELDKILKKYVWKSVEEIRWYPISRDQKFSEDFIREFKDKVNWENISYYQKLSYRFILEFQDNLDLKELENREIIKVKKAKMIIEPAKNILKSVEHQIINKFDLMDLE